MLIGCCHCGETPPSESTPPSQSVPPSGSISQSTPGPSDGPLSTDPLTCGVCIVVPAKWVVTLSGWNGINASHDTCCGGMNGEYLLSISTATSTICTIGSSYCRIWESAEKAKHLGTANGTPPPCTNETSPRVMLAMTSPLPPTTNIVVSVLYGRLGGFGTATADCFQYSFTSSAGCFYSGPVTWVSYSGGSARCNYGTVTVRPA